MNETHRPKLRILQIVLTLNMGGAELLVVSLAKRLIEKGYACDICSLTDGGALAEEAAKNGLRVSSLGRKEGSVNLSVMKRMYSLLKGGSYDLVHTHNFGPSLYGAPAAKLAGLRGAVYTQHGVMMFPCSRKTLMALKSLSWFTDGWVTVSESVRKDLVKYTGLPEKRFTTIINGIDTEKFTPMKQEALKERLGLSKYDCVIGNVARLSPEKDHVTLLEAFNVLLEKGHNACLVIVGDGIQREHLDQAVRKMGMGKHVYLLGSRRDIADVLGTFDIFANSSKSEGIPLTLLEAMACGLPIVSTGVGGVPEIVIDGVTGRLVPPENAVSLSDAVAELLDDSKRAREMGAAGRNHVESNYSLEAMTEQYLREYHRAAG